MLESMNELETLSNDLAGAVEQAGRSVVAVNGRARFASSGVHWRPGVVVTAEHTVKRDEEVRVALPGGKSVAAAVAGRDAGTDLAVLKIEAGDTPVAKFASGSLRAGSLVLAVGRSAETGVNATLGAISAVAGAWRTWRGGMIDTFVRLDLSLYPGSSGAAIVDASGRVIGIGTSGLSRFAAVAIPAATVDRVVDELLTKGHVSRGYLGVGLQPVALPDHLKKQLGLTESHGVIVLSVEPESPAGKAGVLIGDVLMRLDGKAVTDTDDVQTVIGTGAIGKTVGAGLLRGGVLLELPVTIGERPRRTE